MRLKLLELNGFKSFAKKTSLSFEHPIVAIVGPNGSGKSNIVEAFRFVLGEQSMKSMRGKQGSDLIFKGSKNLAKSNRAFVSVFFNNEDRVFKIINKEGENVDLNFENVSLSREVFTDGVNKYILNNSEVRLKDIHALLSSVNIGASTHHIISQGEADRVLSANVRERKEMIEEALGLRIYQYKIKESEKKLEKANANIKEVGILRRENAPHLNFLKKQIEKFEKGKEMKEELFGLYLEYLKKESIYLDSQKEDLKKERSVLEIDILEVEEKIKRIEEFGQKEENQKIEELRTLEEKLSSVRRSKNELERKLGRIEALVEVAQIRVDSTPESRRFNLEEAENAFSEIEKFVEEASQREDIFELKDILNNIKRIISELKKNPENKKTEENQNNLEDLKKSEKEISLAVEEIEIEENKIFDSLEFLKKDIKEEMEKSREEEREKFSLKVKQQELSSSLKMVLVKEENIMKESEAFQNELKEGLVLIGSRINEYQYFDLKNEETFDKFSQEELKRKIERIKIKLEDIGFGNEEDVLKEFKDAKDRDDFLAKEIDDLYQSIESLNNLIEELKLKIEEDFKNGIQKINEEFKRFFILMFGGGDAKLSLVVENKRKRKEDDEEAEEIEFEQGVEINVSLPSKKVKELHALSGGERSLASIALLFAMSQVNPPPFLILDETDAALDEANSRKYGDMLEMLSKKSQLIVVTHNRETMSRAGVLYGVTIGADGSSMLLSIKFEEALAVAK